MEKYQALKNDFDIAINFLAAIFEKEETLNERNLRLAKKIKIMKSEGKGCKYIIAELKISESKYYKLLKMT